MIANPMKKDVATTCPHKQIIEFFLTCVDNWEVFNLTYGLLPIPNYCIIIFSPCVTFNLNLQHMLNLREKNT